MKAGLEGGKRDQMTRLKSVLKGMVHSTCNEFKGKPAMETEENRVNESCNTGQRSFVPHPYCKPSYVLQWI